MAWVTEGILSNPGVGALLADSGRMFGGRYRIMVVAWADAGVDIVLQQRDPANAISALSQVLSLRGLELYLDLRAFPIPVPPGERLRLVTRSSLVGQVQASLFWEP